MRAGLLGLLVVVGLASLALADDATAQATGPWTDLYGAFEKLDLECGHISIEITTTRNKIRDADFKLAPLRAIEADLASRVPTNDPKLAEARLATHRRVIELKVGVNTVKLIQLQTQELEAREAAIQSGEAARKALEAYFEKMAKFNLQNRQEQMDVAQEKWLRLVKNIDRLRGTANTPVPDFVPLSAVPANPRELVTALEIYEQDAQKTQNLANGLAQRLRVMKDDQARLVKFKQEGAKMPHLDEDLKNLETRIEEIDTARLAASKRADAIRQEIGRLQKHKAEIEKNFSSKPGAKDVEKK